MHLDRAVIASKNADKILEIESILEGEGLLDEVVQGLDWPDVEETETSLEGNALLKARAVCEATGLPAIADDTGLEVDALDGAPGVHTARFAGPNATYQENVAALLHALQGLRHRSARFRTAMALAMPDGTELVAEGSLEGTIALVPRGDSGFGYDPVFEVEGRTLAEMDGAEKHAISHRGRAIRALVDVIRMA